MRSAGSSDDGGGNAGDHAAAGGGTTTKTSQQQRQQQQPFRTPPPHRTGSYDSITHMEDDENDNEEIRALAAKLRPAFEQADALLSPLTESMGATGGGKTTGAAQVVSDTDDDDDDDMDDELDHLKESESLLRQELAADFSSLFMREEEEESGVGSSAHQQAAAADLLNRQLFITPAEIASGTSAVASTSTQEADITEGEQQGTGGDTGGVVQVDGEIVDPRTPIRIPSPPSSNIITNAMEGGSGGTTTTALMSASPQQRLMTPIALHQMQHNTGVTPEQLRLSLVLISPPPLPSSGGQQQQQTQYKPYTNGDHVNAIQLKPESKGGWYSVNLTPLLLSPETSSTIADTTIVTTPDAQQQDDDDAQQQQQQQAVENNSVGLTIDTTVSSTPQQQILSTTDKDLCGVKEYCLALPSDRIKRMFVCVPDKGAVRSAAATQLPVRTLVIRIRPDVLVGAVMDAVYGAIQTLPGHHVHKRQGGHLQAMIGRTTMNRPQPQQQHAAADATNGDATRPSGGGNGEDNGAVDPISLPPYFVDIQLTTCKTEDCERMLLIRIYHLHGEDYPTPQDSDEAAMGSSPTTSSNVTSTVAPETPTRKTSSSEFLSTLIQPTPSTEPINIATAARLREACAMVQRLESPSPSNSSSRRIRPLQSPSPKRNSSSLTDQYQADCQYSVKAHLLEHYKACPSVKEGSITLPALNPEDWPVIVSSCGLLHAVWEELETLDLTWTAFTTTKFGAFPALVTLDNHYCSQIRRVSREFMIVSLLRSASELEEYGREVEYVCANMISLLQPTFDSYGMEAPPLPKPTPLTSYPLDFTPPQTTCPPWGRIVMEALNEIQALNDSTTATTDATSASPQNSFDIAESAVRRVFMAFQKQDDEEQNARLGRKNVQIMDRLAKMKTHQRASIEALHRAGERSRGAQKAADEFNKLISIREVPLLKWSVVVGGSTGTCTITANHVLFCTQLIPVIGGNKTTLFNIRDIEFAFQEATPSLMKPFPHTISVRDLSTGQDVFSFRPSTAGPRLKSLVDVVREEAEKDPLPPVG